MNLEFSVETNMKELKEAKTEQIAAALEAIGAQVEAYAKLACPVDTGNLRNSITHEQDGDATEVIGSAVEYAAYVEMGTQKTKAQPYLEPAVTNHTQEYKRIAEEYLRK